MLNRSLNEVYWLLAPVTQDSDLTLQHPEKKTVRLGWTSWTVSLLNVRE